MRSSKLSLSSLLAAASIMGMAASTIPPAVTKMAAQGYGFGGGGRRKLGPGWSNAHVKRMALKKRNRARNRAAHR